MKINIERMISKLITDKRNEVINALMLSGIKVYGNITNQDLFDLTMNELKKGNADLNTHLGDVIDATFDLSPLNEPMSGGDGKPFGQTAFGGALKDNAGNIINTGVGILGNLFGGGGSSTSTVAPTTSGGSSNDLLVMQMNLQQQAAAAEAQRARDEAAARSRNTWLIVGVVGGLVVIGGIVAIVLTRKN